MTDTNKIVDSMNLEILIRSSSTNSLKKFVAIKEVSSIEIEQHSRKPAQLNDILPTKPIEPLDISALTLTIRFMEDRSESAAYTLLTEESDTIKQINEQEGTQS